MCSEGTIFLIHTKRLCRLCLPLKNPASFGTEERAGCELVNRGMEGPRPRSQLAEGTSVTGLSSCESCPDQHLPPGSP